MGEDPYRYLKWHDDVVAHVHRDLSVEFADPVYNTVVRMYTGGARKWSSEQFRQFLSERIASPARRDIERILFRCGLSEYDTFAVADATRAINPRDELWLARSTAERFDDATSHVFDNVFVHRTDAQGDSVDTPEGANVKRYAAHQGAYGIVKQRISPIMTDAESEIAVYLLACEMGVPCCPARRFDADSVFSEFVYDFTKEHLVHMRRLFDGPRGGNEVENLLSVRPQYADGIHRMLALDFVTRQDDRHLSNIAVKVSADGEELYPLYDNGRSLFYEDTEEFVATAAADPVTYATTFGYSGTYWDHIQDAKARGVDFSALIKLDVLPSTVERILIEAGFSGYRLEGASRWIANALALLRAV